MPRKPQLPLDDECKAARLAVLEALKRKKQSKTREASEEYRARRREDKKLSTAKKRELIKSKLSAVKPDRKRDDFRRLCGPEPSVLKDNEGNLVTDPRDIVKILWQRFKRRLDWELTEVPISNFVGPPNVADIRTAIKVETSNAADLDKLTKMLYNTGGVLAGRMHPLIRQVWDDESMPADWSNSSISTIFEEGDPTSCKKYSGISISSVVNKILPKILCKYLKPYCKDRGHDVFGFRPGKAAIDQVFALRKILEETYEIQNHTADTFVDFKAAYESLDRLEVYRAMCQFKVPAKLIRLSRMILEEDKRCAELFQTCIKFLEQDAQSSDFFNLVLKHIVRSAREDPSLQHQQFGIDDGIDEEASTSGQPELIGSLNFELVQKFIYLGIDVSNIDNFEEEISRRIVLANHSFCSLSKQLPKLLSRENKKFLYKSQILPVLLCGAETWTTSSRSEQMLASFERKVLREIFRRTRENGVSRERHDHELSMMYLDLDIVSKVRRKRLQLLRHLDRMANAAPAGRMVSDSPDRRMFSDSPDRRMVSDAPFGRMTSNSPNGQWRMVSDSPHRRAAYDSPVRRMVTPDRRMDNDATYRRMTGDSPNGHWRVFGDSSDRRLASGAPDRRIFEGNSTRRGSHWRVYPYHRSERGDHVEGVGNSSRNYQLESSRQRW